MNEIFVCGSKAGVGKGGQNGGGGVRFLTASREGLCELLGLLCQLIWILDDTLLLNSLALTFFWKVGRVSWDPRMANQGLRRMLSFSSFLGKECWD